MNLADLAAGDRVFIDANVFIYHFLGRSPQCRMLLDRCARQELRGFTSTSILAEVLHRLMVAEAIEKQLVPPTKATSRLKERPELVKQLHRYNEDVNSVADMNVTILSLTTAVLRRSENVRVTTGLMTNDSLVVAFMENRRLRKLATADADFDRLTGIAIFKPNDYLPVIPGSPTS